MTAIGRRTFSVEHRRRHRNRHPRDRLIIVQPQARADYQLKHRLLGAVILLGVAVLVIPWLLSVPDDANHQHQTREANYPQIVPLSVDERVASGEDATQVNSTPIANATQTNPPQALLDNGWAVQVGLYEKSANAEATFEKLVARGFSPDKTAVKNINGNDVTRIWLGPYTKKQRAEEVSASARLKTVLGEKGFVIKHTP